MNGNKILEYLYNNSREFTEKEAELHERSINSIYELTGRAIFEIEGDSNGER